VCRVEVDDDHIGLGTDLEASGVGSVHGECALCGTHLENLTDLQELDVGGHRLVDEAGELHLLEEIARVVAGRAVGGKADRDTGRHDRAQGHRARTQLGIADGAVGDLRAGAGENRYVAVVEAGAVRCGHVGSEKAEAVEPLDGAHPVGLDRVGNFLLALGQVGVNRYSE